MDEVLLMPRDGLDPLFQALESSGREIMGPMVREGVIRYSTVRSPDDLPWGVADEQAPGSYCLVEAPASRAFSWTTAVQAAKPICFSPEEMLWEATRDTDGSLSFVQRRPVDKPKAVIGLRGCDLAALDLHDRHFAEGHDPWYRARREGLFIIAVNCARSTATCFCASTGDGPAATEGYDLLLDEIDEGFLVRSGSTAGEKLLSHLALSPATTHQIKAAATQTAGAAAAQTRQLPAGDLEESLNARLDVAAWNAIAERCLACGNCTAVCPSCFCHRHTEAPALDARASVHGREWDSCFSEGHSLMHGRSHRADIAHRYRQWLTHKFGTWHSQYGRSGCTGCGRCLTWCPVGIDVTESLATVFAEEPR